MTRIPTFSPAVHLCTLFPVCTRSLQTGFEHHDGRPRPTLDGILVELCDAAAVSDAAIARAQAAAERAAAKKAAAVIDRWRRLVHGMLTRARLNDTYTVVAQAEARSSVVTSAAHEVTLQDAVRPDQAGRDGDVGHPAIALTSATTPIEAAAHSSVPGRFDVRVPKTSVGHLHSFRAGATGALRVCVECGFHDAGGEDL